MGHLAKERRESQLLILSSLQVEDFLCSRPSENKDEQLPNPLPVKYICGFLPTLNSWSTSIAKEALVFPICHPTLYSVFQSCFDPVLGATTVLSLIPTSRLLHPNRHPLISSPGSEATAPYAFVPINRLLFLARGFPSRHPSALLDSSDCVWEPTTFDTSIHPIKNP